MMDKLFSNSNNNGIVAIILLLLLAFGVYKFSEYLTKKSNYGLENYSSGINNVYSDGSTKGYNNSNGLRSNNSSNIQNPTDLLPANQNNQWSSLNPNGKGELSNINLLKAGYHIGIDTIGQTLRNPNLQLRSETPNPQNNVSPWNRSTITGDPFRVAFELGQGPK